MYFKALPITMVIGAMIHNIAIAEVVKQQPMFKVSPSPEIVAAYWTPERMQNAIPMDLPRVEIGSLNEISSTELAKKLKDQSSEGDDGAAPSENFVPDTTQIFKPIHQQIMPKASLDTGTLGQQFTSAQLTPLTANTSYPYATVGKLFFTTPTGNKTCSASVIRKRILLTAGHCVHNGNGSSTGWFTNFMFVPAYNNGTAPFQTWTSTYSSVMSTWLNGGGTIPNPMDYGVIEVADKSINGTLQLIGNVVGYLGWQTGATIPNHAHIIGYSSNLDSGNLMHEVTAQSARAVDANNVEYGSDMTVGAGGSPWIQNFGAASAGQTGGTNAGRNRVIGTSSYAYNNTTSLANGGSLFDNNFVTLLNFICAHKTGNC